MAERPSEGRGSFPLNLQTLLVLLLLASSVWLVSQKLTSTRPAALIGIGRPSPGDQNVEARLWEDPFKTPDRHNKGEGKPASVPNFTELLSRIKERCNEGKDDKRKNGMILPVMIPGGPYSEDQESRIRTRFAIVSALSQAGYVSEDPENLGSVTLDWPTTQALRSLKGKAAAESPPTWTDLRTEAISPRPSADKASTPRELGYRRDLRFEWYRLRDFHPRSGLDKTLERTDDIHFPFILVLWLNERDFEDEPLIRLPLMLGPIVEVAQETNCPLRLALIGPGRSSTLRAMLPVWETGKVPLQSAVSEQLWQKISYTLRHVEVYSPTATAMDEVLVQQGGQNGIRETVCSNGGSAQRGTNDGIRERACLGTGSAQNSASDCTRVGVCRALTEIGFKSFRNFVATDHQLATEMLDELGLRGVDFTQDNNHLVLLSEWDTFYGRMLSLTYAAELAVRQERAKEPGKQTLTSVADFVKQYRNKEKDNPSNLHSFVYLRGLDGQTTGHDAGSTRGAGSEEATRTNPTSLEDLRKWTPDANKAEGRAQFDYLSRLSEQLADLEDNLREDDQHIRAIGIVGSDVYDILLILQALRDRFPNVFFFTTGLDARFWHPRERPWSRNLIVTSSYGLSLDRTGQKSVPWFRDSWQTGQYVATLEALKPFESQLKLPLLTDVPPRRFEIGRHGAVDLSRSASLPHPPLTRHITLLTWVVIGIVCALAAVLLTIFFGPLRRLTWEASQFRAGTLRYREEDVGGIEGSLALMRRLWKLAEAQQDDLALWLDGELKSIPLGLSFQGPLTDAGQQEEQRVGNPLERNYTLLLDRIETAKPLSDNEQTNAKAQQELERCEEELLRVLLDLLNRLLHRRIGHPGGAIKQTRLLPDKCKVTWESWWPASQAQEPERDESLQRLRSGRTIIDALIRKLAAEPYPSGGSEEQDLRKDIAKKAQAARHASLALDDLRRRWIHLTRGLALIMVLLAIGLSVLIWYDSGPYTRGEPFSPMTGTSAWPAQIVRFAAFALAISLSFQSYQSLQSMMLELTRRFRLPLVGNSSLHASDGQKPGQRPAKIRHRLNRTFGLPAPPEPGGVVDASKLWIDYQHYGLLRRRFWRILGLLGLYILFCVGCVWLGSSPISPLRGSVAWGAERIILFAAVMSFLFLTFLIIDAVRLCRWFIQALSDVSTKYPRAATNHFARLRGLVNEYYLDEWIDLQVIADLTEHVGRLVYYPFLVFLLLLLARNDWWDRWPWSWSLIIIFVANLALAASSVVILQTAARKAKREAETTLEAKVNRLQAAIAKSPAENDANQAQTLLEEIRNLRRGAFVPFWENPVLGAILLPSSGAVALQLLIWLVNP
jgi:hypothetical protein